MPLNTTRTLDFSNQDTSHKIARFNESITVSGAHGAFLELFEYWYRSVNGVRALDGARSHIHQRLRQLNSAEDRTTHIDAI